MAKNSIKQWWVNERRFKSRLNAHFKSWKGKTKMEWNIKNNPTFKDIAMNRSPFF